MKLVSGRDPKPPGGSPKAKALPEPPPKLRQGDTDPSPGRPPKTVGPWAPASTSGPPPKWIVLNFCPGLANSASNPLSHQGLRCVDRQE